MHLAEIWRIFHKFEFSFDWSCSHIAAERVAKYLLYYHQKHILGFDGKVAYVINIVIACSFVRALVRRQLYVVRTDLTIVLVAVNVILQASHYRNRWECSRFHERLGRSDWMIWRIWSPRNVHIYIKGKDRSVSCNIQLSFKWM